MDHPARQARRLAIASLLAGLFCLTLSSGCAATRVHTSHQLDKGENVVSFAIEEPGATFIPRLSLQWVHGFNWGDFSLWAGGSGLTLDSGLGLRFYPSDSLNLDIAASYQLLSNSTAAWFYDTDAIFPVVGISSSTTPSRPLYWGTDVAGIIADPSSGAIGDRGTVAHMLKIGYEARTKRRFSLQVELAMPTVAFTDGELISYGDQRLAALIQLDVGLNWW